MARKIFGLLEPAERHSAVVLLGLMLIGMALETLGIGIVIPAVALLTQPNYAEQFPALQPLLGALGNPSQVKLITAGMLILFVLYLIKAMFLVFLSWKLNAFVFGVQANLSQRLFSGYLRQPWTFHLQRNSAQLIRNATTSTNILTHEILLPGMKLVAESLVVLGIATLLLMVEPLGALLVVAMLGLAAWTYHQFTRSHILRWGEARQHHEGLRIQHLQQGLGGAKEVKLLGREAEFIAQYSAHNLSFAKAGQRQNTLLQTPPIWLELLAMTGLAALVLVMLSQGKPLHALLPTLGLFAAAAFRIMPSANRLIDAVQKLRYGLPVVDTLAHEIQLLDAAETLACPPPIIFREVISLDRVRYLYPGADVAALDEVSLTIPRGAAVGFIGDSGAGKSTLVDVILGLLAPVSGRVTVDGTDIRANLRDWQNKIGYVPQSIFLTDDSVRRNVAFGLPDDHIDSGAVKRAIQAAQLEGFVSGLPQGLDTHVGERGVRLSGGQRQRIGIARALYHDPAVLVLDEATSSLDAATEEDVMNAVNALHGTKTLLIIAHRLSTVSHCDRLYRLAGGRVREEPVSESLLEREKGRAE